MSINHKSPIRWFTTLALLLAFFLALFLAFAMPAQAEDLKRLTRELAGKDGFNGVVLVAQGTQVQALEAFGVADAEAARPMTTGTRFESGSISKWIAAIVVMKMVDQGRLALDAPISRYLPDYRPDTGAKLTLRHLMTHSSGLPNQVAAARQADPALRDAELPQMEAVRRYGSGDLRFAPGSDWDYSHSNWLVVKAIVERVSRQSYAQVLDELLLRPLGLKNSGLFQGDSVRVDGMAVGYSTLTPAPQRRASPIPGFMAMAGGFYTTAPDLLRLLHGLLDGDLLSAASRQTLMTVAMPDQHYALGGRTRLQTIAGSERLAAWEDGSNGGFRMLAHRVLADGHTVLVLNNSSFDHARLGALADALLEASYR